MSTHQADALRPAAFAPAASRPNPVPRPPFAALTPPQMAWAMAEARLEARLAAQRGEVPVGAVVVFEGAIVARAHNLRECRRDPLAHAELLALADAARALGRWRLSGCSLVVTLEPCPMCAGGVVNSRIDQLVFGAYDARGGAVGSLCNIVEDVRLNHRAAVVGGFEATESAALLRAFFAARRRRPKSVCAA